ncbi:hypothetical protein [Raineyella sp. W15-4]|uniref:hypothetical protein n=1 Tax=Raineyella sp. W15-4 TaxID=3081651 RepID=UPI00295374DD|nr:hypothetical protein [Raineyella sp. W15-4]WOQ16196.1 hypothetical protein R0145_13410 [Raineyella sp. W15-4]
MLRSTVVRAVAVAAAALALTGGSRWAYAAPGSGTDRTGTWIALAVAVAIALVAGVIVLVGPGRLPRRQPSPDDTGEIALQRALAAETHARRADVDRHSRGRRRH